MNIFLLHGEDSYSSNQKLQYWKKGFIKKYGEDANIEIFEGKTLNPGIFESNIETLPFLCDKRLIIVKNIFKKGKDTTLKKIAEIIDKTPDFCILIFIENGNADKRLGLYKKIKKIGKTEEFKELSSIQINQWINKKAKEEEIKISPITTSYLSQEAGLNLWKIANELEKLKIYANGKEITKEMIDNIVSPSLSASIFKLTDSIAEKKPKIAIKTLETLKESGEDLFRTFFMIVRHFRILIQVHDLLSKNENPLSIAKKLKQAPFVISKTSKQARNFSSEDLKNIYKKLLEIDIATKTGKIKAYQKDSNEFQLEIEKLILKNCI